MKLLRHLKEKRYLILAFTLPAIFWLWQLSFCNLHTIMQRSKSRLVLSSHRLANLRRHPNHRALVLRHLLQRQVSLRANRRQQAQR